MTVQYPGKTGKSPIIHGSAETVYRCMQFLAYYLCIVHHILYACASENAWDSSDPQDDTIGFYIFDYELEFMT